jgi:tripartite-type tricarboxylate transporter receptor subunit TctC
VVIENRPGGGGNIGIETVAKSAPDGYTLLVCAPSLTISPSLYSKLGYDPLKDFAPVTLLAEVPNVITIRQSLPANNLKELLAYAKANPGKLNYASSGPGTPYHMAGELLKSMADINAVHVPYKGSSGARTDVIGGQVDLMFDAVTTMTEQVRGGKVKALATTGLKRSDVMPEVPTLTEAGVAGYEATIWLGLMAPTGTPKAVVDKLNEAVSKIASQPDVKATWTKQGAAPMVMNPAVFDKYMRDDITKWAGVIKKANIKLD